MTAIAAKLNEGATSLAAANWSDATGFAADAKLGIGVGSQTINSDLDQSANAIDFLHILRGFTGTIGPLGGDAMVVQIDNTYTTDPNFFYAAGGGLVRVEFDTNACPNCSVDSNGTLHITAGTVTDLYVSHGDVVVYGAATVTNLYAQGGVITLMAGAGSDPTLVEVRGPAVVHLARAPATLTMRSHRSRVTLDAPGDSVGTAMNGYGGRLTVLAGDLPTYIMGSEFLLDLEHVTEHVAVGGTSASREAGSNVLGRYNPQVAFTDATPVGGFSSGASSGGG